VESLGHLLRPEVLLVDRQAAHSRVREASELMDRRGNQPDQRGEEAQLVLTGGFDRRD
jgi:hypothetical protein